MVCRGVVKSKPRIVGGLAGGGRRMPYVFIPAMLFHGIFSSSP
jgi:hypothetical protein